MIAWVALALVQPSAPAALFTLSEGYKISGITRGGRHQCPIDPIAELVAAIGSVDPITNREIAGKTWVPFKLGEPANGLEPGQFAGGYAAWKVTSSAKRIAVLEANAHGSVLVNGEPHVGDPYAYGMVSVPVELKTGDNWLLFTPGRGNLTARLVEPRAQLYALPQDPTLPDLRRDKPGKLAAGIILINATESAQKPSVATEIEVTLENGTVTRLPAWKMRLDENIAPCSIAKWPLWLNWKPIEKAKSAKVLVDVTLGGKTTRTCYDIGLVGPFDARKETFVSDIDGSAQYYAVQPCRDASVEHPALVLSLHGASVEAISQARAYGPKTWADIVCPTNRRPFGFDWEDWGRLDAMEVLRVASARLNSDPLRTYLTGHSMGGHGTWQLGVQFPDRWAGIAPCSGWESFYTYAGKDKWPESHPMGALLNRTDLPSETKALLENLRGQAVFIMHGEKDDNVPVEEARRMREQIKDTVALLGYHEEPGAGHWYETSPEPGAECEDYPAIFDMFASRSLPPTGSRTSGNFVVVDPSIWAGPGGIQVVQQEAVRKISAIQWSVEKLLGNLNLEVSNAKILRVDGKQLGIGANTVRLTIGGKKVELPSTGGTIQRQGDGSWKQIAAVPIRPSGFKAAMDRNCVLVYGTQGDPALARWSLAKARYDAEQFWYRGNGRFRVVADVDYLANAKRYQGCNAVFYGSSAVNKAWLVAQPQFPSIANSDSGGILAMVPTTTGANGFVGGKTIESARLTDRLPLFSAGVGYPDYTLLGADFYTKQLDGIKAAGFWSDTP
ncbi:MAG: prolyl oligopeptidase family serine peptidase [Armatimonadetes bacterium]|nr:prolyl oligopeptidase family serine peptidase [Armatimonadota bacterium]